VADAHIVLADERGAGSRSARRHAGSLAAEVGKTRAEAAAPEWSGARHAPGAASGPGGGGVAVFASGPGGVAGAAVVTPGSGTSLASPNRPAGIGVPSSS